MCISRIYVRRHLRIREMCSNRRPFGIVRCVGELKFGDLSISIGGATIFGSMCRPARSSLRIAGTVLRARATCAWAVGADTAFAGVEMLARRRELFGPCGGMRMSSII